MRLSAALAFLVFASACKKADTSALQEPHQTLEEFTLKQSESGKPVWSLTARTAILREDQKQALLNMPRMQFYKKGRAITDLSADSGVVRTDTSDVRLSSSVVVNSLDDKSVLKTSELLYSSTKKKFLTDRDVVITRPGGTLRGRGLEASPDLSEIRIFHQTSSMQGKPL